MLNELDEETEITPHIKMSKDFEVYEPIKVQPPYSILPWDDNVKQTYDLYYKVENLKNNYIKNYKNYIKNNIPLLLYF